MIKIRLARYGKKNDPFYRIVATEHTVKITGKPLEILGYWHPKKDIKKIDEKEALAWINKGATVSKAVEKLFGKLTK